MKRAVLKIGEGIDKFNNALELVAGIAAFAMMAMLCFQVLMRYAFKKPIYGIDELVIAIMVWVCAIGWATVYWQNGHAILEFIVKRMGRIPRKIIFNISNVIVQVISILFIPASIQLFKMQADIRPVGGLPFGRAYYYALPVIVMSVIMLFYATYKSVAFIVTGDERIVAPEAREEGNAIE